MAERVTHVVRNTITSGTPSARATHMVRNVITSGQPSARATHMVRNVIVQNTAADGARAEGHWRD